MSNRGFVTVLRVVYAIVTVVILVWILLDDSLSASSNREPNIALSVLMAILTFPAGVVFVLCLTHAPSPVSPLLLSLFANRYVEALGIWSLMFFAGWVQWFLLVPWLLRTISRWRADRRGAGA